MTEEGLAYVEAPGLSLWAVRDFEYTVCETEGEKFLKLKRRGLTEFPLLLVWGCGFISRIAQILAVADVRFSEY